MPDLFDLFDDPPPAPTPPTPEKPAVAAPEPPPARAPAPDANTPCSRPFGPMYRCRVGGGDAGLSDDHGRSWFCYVHAPRGFFAKDREARR
jgi:hypothetical protein